MNISEVHKEAINEYIDNKLKDRHLLEPDIDSYAAFRIKQLAEDMFYAGYKEALETEDLKKEHCCGIRIKLDTEKLKEFSEELKQIKKEQTVFNINNLTITERDIDEIINDFIERNLIIIT